MKRLVIGLIAALVLFGGIRFLSTDEAEKSGEALAQVNVPNLSVEDRVGESAFNTGCASCHGANAAGKNGVGPPLIHKIYEPSHHSDMSFVLAVKQGVRQHHWNFGNMQAVDGVSDQDIQSIISYVRAVQRENGID